MQRHRQTNFIKICILASRVLFGLIMFFIKSKCTLVIKYKTNAINTYLTRNMTTTFWCRLLYKKYCVYVSHYLFQYFQYIHGLHNSRRSAHQMNYQMNWLFFTSC